MKTLFPFAAFIGLICCASVRAEDLPTVSRVDLEKYLGVWYEIARLPHPKQEGCYATTATYSLEKNGTIGVLNQCRKDSFDGELRSAKGKAKVVDAQTNAKLKVQFFWPFWGDYWILALDEKYSYALVGEPKRRYLWILSRKPELPESIYADLTKKAQTLGFDLGKFTKTPQQPSRPAGSR